VITYFHGQGSQIPAQANTIMSMQHLNTEDSTQGTSATSPTRSNNSSGPYVNMNAPIQNQLIDTTPPPDKRARRPKEYIERVRELCADILAIVHPPQKPENIHNTNWDVLKVREHSFEAFDSRNTRELHMAHADGDTPEEDVSFNHVSLVYCLTSMSSYRGFIILC
jgi:hypothetical protein